MKSDFRNIGHQAIHISATWFRGRNAHGALLRITSDQGGPLPDQLERVFSNS